MCTTDDIHVCAECLDFLGGGDWGLCCKSADYHDLCYDYTLACGRFKPGRKLDLRIRFVSDDDRMYRWTPSSPCSLAKAVDVARGFVTDGCTDVCVYYLKFGKYPCLLWNEQIERDYWK